MYDSHATLCVAEPCGMFMKEVMAELATRRPDTATASAVDRTAVGWDETAAARRALAVAAVARAARR